MNDCPFCGNVELKSRIIDETCNTITILSNPALVNYHLFVIPKKHVEKLSDLTCEERTELFEQAVKFQNILLKKFGGCDIRQNCRPFQKQDTLKVNHVHIHLQPRTFKDELYTKSQIFETSIFRNLNNYELNRIKSGISELKEEIKNAN